MIRRFLKTGVLFMLMIWVVFAWSKKEEADALQQVEKTQIEENKEKPQIQQKEGSQLPSSGIENSPNPFLTREEEESFKDTGKRIPLGSMMLSAVVYSQVEKSKAIINGRILREGDLIENKQVIEIQPEAVVLKDIQGEYIVTLKNVLE